MPRSMVALLAAFAVGVSASRGAAEEFAVVSYNIHGLPSWIARDDPAKRMPEIGGLLSRYDVALVQEEWAWSDALSEHSNFALRVAGNPARSSWLEWLSIFCGPCGSGLALLAALEPDRLVASDAIAYELCADWITSANDCFATKGFVFARLRLRSGVEIDFVNTHLEAGDGEPDLRVRERQLERLERFLVERSAGRSLVVGGDLNLDFDDPPEREVVERFRRALDLRDSGARPGRDGRWRKRIDYLLFRSADPELSLVAAGEDRAFEREGVALSDHPAVFARLRVERRRGEALSPGSGVRGVAGSERPGLVHDGSTQQAEIPPSTGITAPVTYEPARDAR
ncbi:Sphingomyelinase [Myxococcaceae bacterium]|nr:Sphingomyelinase [Myxococcaceae bacterium]